MKRLDLSVKILIALAAGVVEGMLLIMGIERILDMARTAVNVMGDCSCSLVVAALEKNLQPPEEIV